VQWLALCSSGKHTLQGGSTSREHQILLKGRRQYKKSRPGIYPERLFVFSG